MQTRQRLARWVQADSTGDRWHLETERTGRKATDVLVGMFAATEDEARWDLYGSVERNGPYWRVMRDGSDARFSRPTKEQAMERLLSMSGCELQEKVHG
jgi:hypothetical protein